MKRNLIAPFMLAMLLILVACGGEGESQSEEPVVIATAAPAEPTLPPATETPLPPPPVSVDTESSEAVVENAEPEAVGLAPWPADRFGYGIQIHGDATYGNSADTANVVKDQLGLQWVKMQIKWSAVRIDGPDSDQWFLYDGTIDEIHKKGLYLMVSVVSAPKWTRAAGNEHGPPDDYALYVDFINQLLDRHGDKIHAIEVWNEQNIDREWSTANGIQAGEYVQLLSMTYGAIKAYNPDIIVISGALSPTGVNDGVTVVDDFIYLDQALAAGMLTYSDCVGVHHNGYNLPPDVAFDQTGTVAEAATAIFRGPFDNLNHSWSFFTTLDVYAQKVQAIDPAKKLCVTEFGWASSEGYPEYPETFEFALDNSLEEQATFIVQAFQQMRASNDVWLTFLFNYDFGNKGWGYKDDTVPYSIVSREGIPRPAFGAVAEMPKD